MGRVPHSHVLAHRKYRHKSARRCHANRQKSVKPICSAWKPQ
jgi:hypothetical protein